MRAQLEAALRLPENALMVLFGGTGKAAIEALEAILEGGCRFVQYREKEAPRREVLATAGELAPRAREAGALLVINDHVGIAQLHACGVHLGQQDFPPAEARRILGEEAIIGASAHDRAELDGALEQPIDYVGLGTIFASPSKPDLAARGTDLIRELAPGCRLPIFAIGGIDAARALECIAAGATGVAVSSAVTAADDPVAATRALHEAVVAARRGADG